VKILEVDGLSRGFGGVLAVDSLSFAVEEGSIYSVIGPNGAGKTTLFNLITGLYKPSAGQVRFAGEEVTGMAPHLLARRGMSRSFQNLQIFFNMTARENVMVGRHRHLVTGLLPALLRLPRVARSDEAARDQAARLLEFVGLGDYIDAESDSMPYGALKRLELARALASEPRLLLLDEPAAGLNPVETREIDALIVKAARSGVTILLVEHDMRLVMGVSHRILVLDYGRKLAEGTAKEVRADKAVIEAYLGAGAAGTD
jgi:branched-chain amino acid transport system ATP-binding protein